MIPLSSSIPTPKQGLSLDDNLLSLPSTAYSYAYNALVDEGHETGFLLGNEASTIRDAVLPEGMQVMCYLRIPGTDEILLFLADSFGVGEIGLLRSYPLQDSHWNGVSGNLAGTYDGMLADVAVPNNPIGIYIPIVRSSCFNWKYQWPLRVISRTGTNRLQIYFVDNFNEDRYLYLNRQGNGWMLDDQFKQVIGYDNCGVAIRNEELSCNAMLWNPLHKRASLSVERVTSDGALTAGSYQLFAAYSDPFGNELTDYQAKTKPIPIWQGSVHVTTDYATAKSIVFNIDVERNSLPYQFITLVALVTVKQVSRAYKVATIPVQHKQYVLTSVTTAKEILTSQLTARRPYYQKSKGITSANDYLFRFGPSEYPKANWQRVANLIPVGWQTVQVPEGAFKNPVLAEQLVGYPRDEVVAPGIIFEMANGEDSPIFPLPGRQKAIYDQGSVHASDLVVSTGCDVSATERWQSYNTAQVVGRPHLKSTECDLGVWEYGIMGYYESTETYPNDAETWGDLCNKPIRFPRIPDCSVAPIQDGPTLASFDAVCNIYPIGLRVLPSDVQAAIQEAVKQNLISSQDAARVSGYRIVRGDFAGQSSVKAKGVIFNVWDYTKKDKKVYYPGYGHNDLRPDSLISNSKETYNNADSTLKDQFKNVFRPNNLYTFHSPEFHFNKAVPANRLYVEAEISGTSRGQFQECNEQARYKFISTLGASVATAAGIAVYLAAYEEQIDTEYVVKADYKHSQISDGKAPYANVTGNITGALPGAIQGSISTSAGSGGFSEGERKEEHNNPYNNVNLNVNNKKGTKVDEYGNPNLGLGRASVAEFTRTYSTNTPYQIMGKITGGLTTGNILIDGLTSVIGNVFGLNLFNPYKLMLAMNEVRIIQDLIYALIPYRNFALQHSSIGNYHTAKGVAAGTGNKVREIVSINELTPTVTEATLSTKTVTVNNWNRESSTLLELKGDFLANPSVVDNSRVLASEIIPKSGGAFDYKSLDDYSTQTVSAYYASLKTNIANQYGSIGSISYLETGQSISLTGPAPFIFGGNTFINRFAIKRKFPFFRQTRFKVANDADVKYEELGNVGYPNFYFDTKTGLLEELERDTMDGFSFNGLLGRIAQGVKTLLNVPKNRLDVDNTGTKVFFQAGYIYLFNYAIPYYFAESTINVDLRHAENEKEGNFYPHVGDVANWVQEDVVPNEKDNTFYYNRDYSKQLTEQSAVTSLGLYPTRKIQVEHPNRIIYAEQGVAPDTVYRIDPWLQHKALNYKDFDFDSGFMTDVKGIESDKLLIRFERGFAVHNAYVTIPTNGEAIQVSNGGMFQTKPQEFNKVPLGYGGSLHQSLVSTEFGHVTIDALRGQLFLLGPGASGFNPLMGPGMTQWFSRHLRFVIQQQFPAVPVDSLPGIAGFALGYDALHHRLLLTKKDYRARWNETTYDEKNRVFIRNNNVVTLNDPQEFVDLSWTLSYNFVSKVWVSFHSYQPTLYIDGSQQFQSIEQKAGSSHLWRHNATDKSYQRIYGRPVPFIVETVVPATGQNQQVTNIEYQHEVRRYHLGGAYSLVHDVTYNRAIVSNRHQSTGWISLHPVDRLNIYKQMQYPKPALDHTDIGVVNVDNYRWRFNQFADCCIIGQRNVPLWIWSENGTERVPNQRTMQYSKPSAWQQQAILRDASARVWLMNDKHFDYKIIHQLTAQGVVATP